MEKVRADKSLQDFMQSVMRNKKIQEPDEKMFVNFLKKHRRAQLERLEMKLQRLQASPQNLKEDAALLDALQKGEFTEKQRDRLMHELGIDTVGAQILLTEGMLSIPPAEGGITAEQGKQAFTTIQAMAKEIHQETYKLVDWKNVDTDGLEVGDVIVMASGENPRVIKRNKDGSYTFTSRRDRKATTVFLELFDEVPTKGVLAGANAHLVTPYDLEQLKQK